MSSTLETQTLLPEPSEENWGDWGSFDDTATAEYVELDPAHEDGRKLKAHLLGLTEIEQTKLDHAFGALDPQYPIPENIVAKKLADEKNGHKLRWAEWIGSPDGATFAEAQQLADWASDRVHKMAKDPEIIGRFEAARQRFGAGLEGAVKAGKLHPSLLEKFQRMPAPTFQVAHVFDAMQYNGMAYNMVVDDRDEQHERTMIVVSRDGNVAQHILNHEQMHSLGHFDSNRALGDGLWNEAAVDEFARAVDEFTPGFTESDAAPGLSDEKDALRATMSLAKMNTVELSEIFAQSSNRHQADFLAEAGKRANMDLKSAYMHHHERQNARAEEHKDPLPDRSDMAFYIAHYFTKKAAKLNLDSVESSESNQ